MKGKGDLVYGTGSEKPSGVIRCPDFNSKNEQGPTPLYYTDEFRFADLNTSDGFFESDYNPHRQPPSLRPIPHNPFPSLTFPASRYPESDFSSFTDSSSEFSDFSTSSSTDSAIELSDTDHCHARLAPLYGFPPLPPRPPLLRQGSGRNVDVSKQYQSGVMMAAQRIKANLCKEEPKRSSSVHLDQPPPKERRSIPGWTDGTDGWRTEVYSFAKPRDHSLPADEREDPKRPYKGLVASSQRQGGVYSSPNVKCLAAQPLSEDPTSPPRNSTVDELYSKYNLAFARRSESRTSMHTSSADLSMAGSIPTTVAPMVKKKEVPILKKGAEGKFIVPNVKLKVSTSIANTSGFPANSYRNSDSRIARRIGGFSVRSMASVTEEDEPSFESHNVESELHPLPYTFTYLPLQHVRGHTTTSVHTPTWYHHS